MAIYQPVNKWEPVIAAARKTVQQNQRFSVPVLLVIHFEAIDFRGSGFHGGHYGRGICNKQSGK